MFHILYTSEVRTYLAPKMIRDILDTSVSNNSKVGVTGLLIARGGRFIQLLEGDRGAVLDTYKRIEKDRRHGEVRMILEFESETRLFPNWSMGHIQNSPVEPEFAQLVESLSTAKTSGIEISKHQVILLLRKFGS